jgi:threonine dehydrogenase-like Zn-dependent dehydrogenase
MKCRSIRYGKTGGVEIIDVDVADPRPNEVQVKGLACGVCAWDVHVFKDGSDSPVSPGHEGVGEVARVGEEVSGFNPGDWVVGSGLGFAEYANCRRDRLYSIPRSGQPQDWIVEPVACVVTGIDHCSMKSGDRIAVLGCGFMGLMFVQALGRSLLERLVAIDVDPKRLEMARQFGATDVFDARSTSRSADVTELQQIRCDTVIDCSGAQKGLDLATRIVRKGGRLNLFGWNRGVAQFSGDLWHMNGITVVNSAPSSAVRDTWPPAITLLKRGMIHLRPLITHVVPLDAYPQLLAKAANKTDGYLKGVVKLAEPSRRG